MTNKQNSTTLLDLVDVLRRLRAPGGCPWDRDQTADSLKPYLLEETYEVLEALDQGDTQDICEELGDLLLQVVFLAQIYTEQELFTIEDVARSITDKLIRRHPHVFAGTPFSNMEELDAQWERIKQSEKNKRSISKNRSATTRNLPALARGQKLAVRHPHILADEQNPVHDELGTSAHIPPEQREKFLGHALFRLVRLGSDWGIDCEQALRRFLDEQERKLLPHEEQTAEG